MQLINLSMTCLAITGAAARYISRSCDTVGASLIYNKRQDLLLRFMPLNVSAFAIPSLSTSDASVAKDSHNRHVIFNTTSGLFSPDSITASIGHQDSFYFVGQIGSPVNTSVVQSQYATPCLPLRGGVDAQPVYSGPIAVNGTVAPAKFVVNVTTTDPIWFYALGGTLCTAGASMVVNQLSKDYHETLFAYRAAASGIRTLMNTTIQYPVHGGEWQSTNGDHFAHDLESSAGES